MMLDRVPNREHRNHPELFTGLSVYDTEEAARGTAQAFAVLGGWIAALDVATLQRTNKFIIRQTRAAGHYTLWGMPKVFTPAITTVVAV
jgi:seryl-tRNA synthetase